MLQVSQTKKGCWTKFLNSHLPKKSAPPLNLLTKMPLEWFYHIVILFYFWLGSTLLGSTFVFTRHFGAKTISSHSPFEDDSSPHISGSGSLIWIKLTSVLFKHVILMWINYLETWLRSDNTSCYYNFSQFTFLNYHWLAWATRHCLGIYIWKKLSSLCN